MSENDSIIFIPDISGFTEFVKDTEINHSRHIISELLEVIIDSNSIDLEIAEIEGDAIFFYRLNNLPGPKDLVEQVRKMFLSFHTHLRTYHNYRICHCGACSTASNLSLKFIVHSGPLGFVTVNNFTKPHGEDVILAHKLLKNTIEQREYLLLTEPLIKSIDGDIPNPVKGSRELHDGFTNYEKFGVINYKYFILSPLHNEIIEIPDFIHPNRDSNPVIFHGQINAPKEMVYEIASNLDFRMKINKNTSKLDYNHERVNRAGMVHECVISNVKYRITTVSNYFGDNKLVYGELIEDNYAIKKRYSYTILEDDERQTKLRYEVHLEINPAIDWMVRPLARLIITRQLKSLFLQLKKFCESSKA